MKNLKLDPKAILATVKKVLATVSGREPVAVAGSISGILTVLVGAGVLDTGLGNAVNGVISAVLTLLIIVGARRKVTPVAPPASTPKA